MGYYLPSFPVAYLLYIPSAPIAYLLYIPSAPITYLLHLPSAPITSISPQLPLPLSPISSHYLHLPSAPITSISPQHPLPMYLLSISPQLPSPLSSHYLQCYQDRLVGWVLPPAVPESSIAALRLFWPFRWRCPHQGMMKWVREEGAAWGREGGDLGLDSEEWTGGGSEGR